MNGAPDRRFLKRMARYWARAERQEIARLDRLDPNDWFDLWHTHPDWNGKGNRCAENQHAITSLTFRLLQRAEQRFSARADPIQIFAIVCANTADNAIYLHTPNPNGTPFPVPFDHVQWSAEPPAYLARVIDRATHDIGEAQCAARTDWIVRARTA